MIGGFIKLVQLCKKPKLSFAIQLIIILKQLISDMSQTLNGKSLNSTQQSYAPRNFSLQ